MNIEDGFAQIKDGECWLKNVHIGPHPSTGAFFQHEAKRDRRLLLHKKEILKLSQQVMRDQFTLVPLTAYFNDRNVLKITLGVAKGKDERDKRQDIMKREVGQDLQRAVKNLRGGL
jgi:SsrA-binding protein